MKHSDRSTTDHRTETLRLIDISAAALIASFAFAQTASAANTYIALGDSITFGETDLSYVGSLGDRGYVAGYANALAAGYGGVRPNVVNLAIDGEPRRAS